MKKTLVVFTTIFALALIFSACKKEETDSFGNIAGTVLDEETGAPVQGATVTLNPTSINIFTGSNGQFEMQEIEAGQYTIQSTKDGYEPNRLIVNVTAGKTTRADFVLKPVQ